MNALSLERETRCGSVSALAAKGNAAGAATELAALRAGGPYSVLRDRFSIVNISILYRITKGKDRAPVHPRNSRDAHLHGADAPTTILRVLFSQLKQPRPLTPTSLAG